MAYRVRWQLVGRSGQPLDSGCLGKGICAYGDAMATVVEFLRPYPEVNHCLAESYWLARRSRDADLVVWVWIERHETEKPKGTVSAWMALAAAAESASTPCARRTAERPTAPDG
jgi:hypothetical protein